MEENRSIATTAYLLQAEQSNQGFAQEREATAVANQGRTVARISAQGEVNAAGAEAGAGGTALSSLMADFHAQEGMFRAANDQNLLFKKQQTENANRLFQGQAVNRIAGIKQRTNDVLAPVDYIGPVLAVVGTGVKGYEKSREAKRVAVDKRDAQQRSISR